MSSIPGYPQRTPVRAGLLGAAARVSVNTFFDDVLMMAEEPRLREARLGLLASIRDLGAGILDWSQRGA